MQFPVVRELLALGPRILVLPLFVSNHLLKAPEFGRDVEQPALHVRFPFPLTLLNAGYSHGGVGRVTVSVAPIFAFITFAPAALASIRRALFSVFALSIASLSCWQDTIRSA